MDDVKCFVEIGSDSSLSSLSAFVEICTFPPTPDIAAEELPSPNCPLSKSNRTRSRAASLARALSSSASFFNASNFAFWRLMLVFCVTLRQDWLSKVQVQLVDKTYADLCIHIPCRKGDLHDTREVPWRDLDIKHTHQNGAWIHFLDVA